jgi:hypothetical protein
MSGITGKKFDIYLGLVIILLEILYSYNLL